MKDPTPSGTPANPLDPRRAPKRRSNGVTQDFYWAQVPEDLVYDDRVSDGAFRLYSVLQRHSNDSGLTYPKRTTLAKLLGCSTDTIDRRTRELVRAGWLDVTPQFEGGEQKPNLYHVRLGGRMDAATLSGTDAAPPSREDAAQNQSQFVSEPLNQMGPSGPREVDPPDPGRDKPKPPRAIVADAVWEARAVKPAGGWIAVAKLAEKFLTGGIEQDRLTRAMIDAPTVSQGAVEMELRRTAPRASARAGNWTEEQRSGPVRAGVWTDD